MSPRYALIDNFTQLNIESWRERIISLPGGPWTRDQLLSSQFCIHSSSHLSVYYTPFLHENIGAPVAICGLTPGFQQMESALRAARDGLIKGVSEPELLVRIQNSAAFTGRMRKNLVAMLDALNVAQRLNVLSASEFFTETGSRHVHLTSVLRCAVFVKRRNYSGAPLPSKDPALREMVLRIAGPELERVGAKLIIPQGKAVEDALRLLVSEGFIQAERVLWGFPHASPANGHRHTLFSQNLESMRSTVAELIK